MRRFTVVAALTAALAIGSALPAFATPELEQICNEVNGLVGEVAGEDLTDCQYDL